MAYHRAPSLAAPAGRLARGSEEIIEQIKKHLNKLVDVIKLVDLNDNRHIERELMLIKVTARKADRQEIKQLVDIFRGRIIDVSENTFTVEMTGTGEKVGAFIGSLDKTLILEVVRSGISGISRGEKSLHS